MCMLYNKGRENKICSADNRYLNQDSFTSLSDCHNTTTWIDHVFTNVSLLPVFQDMSVSYGIVGSDHRPICFNISADVTYVQGSAECTPDVIVPDWKVCNNYPIRISNYIYVNYYKL